MAERFQRIYDSNLWGSDSRSGLGSELDETERLRIAIPALLHSLGAKSLLDIPCGDFRWMSKADLEGIDYTGADIVPALVEQNQRAYGSESRHFVRLDLTRDMLPTADVVLCRDCLVHLSFEHVHAAIKNIKRSGAKYLLTTTFPLHESNTDIPDGDWRLLNFEKAPFSFPAPLHVIEEGCREGDGSYADKSLGLWVVADLP